MIYHQRVARVIVPWPYLLQWETTQSPPSSCWLSHFRDCGRPVTAITKIASFNQNAQKQRGAPKFNIFWFTTTIAELYIFVCGCAWFLKNMYLRRGISLSTAPSKWGRALSRWSMVDATVGCPYMVEKLGRYIFVIGKNYK